MEIQQHIDNWRKAVATWQYTPWPETITTDDLTEYRQWCGLLNKATMQANSKGFAAKAGGADKGKSGGKTMWAAANGHTLKIAYVPRPRQQAVTASSREAYAALNLAQMQQEVAAYIAEKTKDGGDITRNEVAAWSGITIQNVTGRTNEMLKMAGGFHLNGQRCRIVITGRRLDNLPKAKFKNEALKIELWREEPPVTFEPVPVQASLF